MNRPRNLTYTSALLIAAATTACGLLHCGRAVAVAGQPAPGKQSADSGQPPAPAVPSEPPFDGILLLKNGGVVEGHLARYGDRWIVTNNDREMNVPVKTVDLACRSLIEAYDRRRKLITRDTAEAHLALADWCLRYDMLPQAALELLDVRALDPKHPRLRMFDERLAVASRPKSPDVAPGAAPNQPEKKAAATTANRSATQTKLTTPKSKISDAIASSPNTATTAAIPPQVSDVAVERFTRKIQPMLVNNCTTSGCHATGGQQKFQLDRALLHGLSNRQTTMANLAATLAMVDRERAQLSPLVTVPRRPHGGAERPVFGPHQDQLVMQLIDWATLVSPTPELTANAAKVAAGEATGATPSPQTNQHSDPAVTPAAFAATVPDARQTVGQRYGAQLRPTWQPKDPFDPEIFNRQTARDAKSQRDPSP